METAQEIFSAAKQRFTQKQIAVMLGVEPITVRRWQSGQVRPKPHVLRALRDAVRRDLAGSADAAFVLTSPPSERFTFIDLFAGIGGIRLGFERAGGECVFTSEYDSYAQTTYRENFKRDGHEIAGDITKAEVKAAVPRGFDVLLGGFPCQPFSLAGVSKKNSLGRPHGFDCTTQGTLFYEIEQIIRDRRPAAFLLENVKNLKSHDQGRTFSTIMRVLRDELGYDVKPAVFDARSFVPQHRERILIAGFRVDVGFSWDDFRLPDGPDPTLDSVLHREDGTEVDVDEGRYLNPDGTVKDKYTLSDRLWQYLIDYRKKHEEKGNGFGYSMFKRGDVARTLSARYHKDGSEILIWRGENKNPRRLTPRECARLMGFDDSFQIPVSDTRAYKQFGNSVVMPLMAHAARFMKPYVIKAREQVASLQLPLGI